MKKSASVQVIPHVDRRAAFRSICPQQRPTIQPVLEALRELVSNAEDEGATSINILLDKKGKVFRICDNGRGFGRHQKNGFFWIFQSEKKGEHRQGTKTTGQHGTGRLRTLRFAEAIIPCTKCNEDGGDFSTATLTRTDAESIWDGDKTPRHWTETTRPSTWHLPPSASGSAIEIRISDDYWKVVPDPSEILDRLAQQLSPRLEKIVTVNGKHLRPRSILQAFELSISKAEIQRQLGAAAAKALGDCLIELYMPQQKGPDDQIKLGGGKNTICPLKSFIDGLPDPKLAAQVPEVLKSGKHLFGYFFIDGLNDFAAEDRHSLRDEIYDGFHLHLLKFLAEIIGPKVEEAYAKKEEADAKEERKRRLTDFAKQFSKAFQRTSSERLLDTDGEGQLPEGSKPDDDNPPEECPIVVRPAWFHILPGETQQMVVTKHEGCGEEDLEWEDVQGGVNGTLSRTVGKKVTFTATGLGRTKVIVRNRKDPAQSTEVNVTVVKEKKLSISPPQIPVEQGASQRFRARNSEATSGRIQWKMESARGLRLSNGEGLETTLTVSDECPLGTYTLTCCDKDNKSITAQATVEVISGDLPSVELDGKLYYFRTAAVRQPAPVLLQQDAVFTSKGKAGSIMVDFDHPDFLNLAKTGDPQESVRLVLFESIVLLHLAAEHEAGRVGTVEELTDRFQEHRSRFLAKRLEKK